MIDGCESDDTRPQLMGVWRLVSFQDRNDAASAWVDTYGAHVEGLLVYHASGWMSVHVSPDSTSDEQFTSYFGRFEIVEMRAGGGSITGVVSHYMRGATPPELLDEGPERPFELVGERLTLGDGVTWRRVFERLPIRDDYKLSPTEADEIEEHLRTLGYLE